MENKTILQYDLEGNFLKEWDENLSEVARRIGVSHSSLGVCLRNQGETCASFQWRYKRSVISKHIGQAYNVGGGEEPIRVAKYFENRLICVYNSIEEAATKNWLNAQDIAYSIRAGHGEVDSFVFKKID